MNANTIFKFSWVSAVLISVSMPLAQAQGIRCWVNEDGMTECGNVVPPEYSQQEHAEFNERAVKVEEIKRAKTHKELEEERRQEAIKVEAEKRRQEKIAEDQKLLDLFGNEDDIRTTLDARLNNIDLSIERISNFISNTEKNLGDLKNSLEVDSSRHLTDVQKTKIRQDIIDVTQRIQKQKLILNAKLREKDAVRVEFADYLARYQQIMAERAAEAAAKEAKLQADRAAEIK